MQSQSKRRHNASRRRFLKASLAAGAAGASGLLTSCAGISKGFPTIVPVSVFGKNAPSNLIHVAQIGCGRIGRDSEIPGVVAQKKLAHLMAACDLDTRRLAEGKQLIEELYREQWIKSKVKTYVDYGELLANKEIDAVCISTPDHWHAQIAIEAALAGKDVYLQKPAALTIVEGRQMADTIRATGRIFQQGSQQRSSNQFRIACELVRNGRIGRLKEIQIGLPYDPAGDAESEMPVPANLNYDKWLGSTPSVYYTEKRVHPQQDYSRPGWLRCEQFGAGMITGWGAHHFDIAHWGMGTEVTGPISVEATAEFPKSGLWDVHGAFKSESVYANGVRVIASDALPNGVRFIGEEGWIFVSRGDVQATASDPTAGLPKLKKLDASDRRILKSKIKENEIHLKVSRNHHQDWLQSIRTRQETVAPAEVGHRSCSACLLVHAAMKLGRKLTWDPALERFVGDEQANALLRRPQRAPYGCDAILNNASKKA